MEVDATGVMARTDERTALRGRPSPAVARIVIGVPAIVLLCGTAVASSHPFVTVLAAAVILGWTQLAGL